MDDKMSQETKRQLMEKLRARYETARGVRKGQLIDQAVELMGYHRKSAIRALRDGGRPAGKAPAVLKGRPREYDAARLLPVLKPVWLAARQPCGVRLKALLPEWVPAYEADHRKIDADVREALLAVSARTLDRIIAPLRAGLRRRGGTRPGSLLRQSIPIRGNWDEEGAGWLEVDTVALCGGSLDDRHLWMLDAVDIRTDWTEQRALENRGQHCTLEQIRDVEESLPFALRGVDSDNGGEFINHHLAAYLLQRKTPVLFTRSRAYHKNDNAHVEQRNWTHVRQQFGYERYDNPAVAPMINALCRGALGRFQNHFLPTQKLKGKKRAGGRTVRWYGPARTPYARVMDSAEAAQKTKDGLRLLHGRLNPFQMEREIEAAMKAIEKERLLKA